MTTRKPGEPWYTALYRDPHTYWWLPALAGAAVCFGIVRLLGGSGQEGLSLALAFAVVHVGVAAYRRRRRPE